MGSSTIPRLIFHTSSVPLIFVFFSAYPPTTVRILSPCVLLMDVFFFSSPLGQRLMTEKKNVFWQNIFQNGFDVADKTDLLPAGIQERAHCSSNVWYIGITQQVTQRPADEHGREQTRAMACVVVCAPPPQTILFGGPS